MAYVTEKRGVFYAVIYEGRNPVSGRESRRWHRCEDHAAASKLATELTDRRSRQRSAGSSLTLGEYLLGQWLPAKEATLAPFLPTVSRNPRPLAVRWRELPAQHEPFALERHRRGRDRCDRRAARGCESALGGYRPGSMSSSAPGCG